MCAENLAGIGKVSRSSGMALCRDNIECPGPPEVVSVGKDNIKISWEKPSYDGGSKIIGWFEIFMVERVSFENSLFSGYVIEKKELPAGRWTKCNFSNVLELSYNAVDLSEKSEYIFRLSFLTPSIAAVPKLGSVQHFKRVRNYNFFDD